MSSTEKFVRDLELADGDSSMHFEPVFTEAQDFLEATEKDKSIMNYRSLNSFIAGVSRQSQEDVLNSLL